MADLDPLNRRLHGYQNKGHYSTTMRRPVANYESKYVPAVIMQPVLAALAAHGTTDKWENFRVIPLANADEVHNLVFVPGWADLRYPVYLRWHLIPGNAASGGTLTTTVDKINMGVSDDFVGSDDAGDGVTALDTVIPAITDAETTIDKPFASDFGKINGQTARYHAIFVKLVAASMSGADRLRVVALEVAFKKLQA